MAFPVALTNAWAAMQRTAQTLKTGVLNTNITSMIRSVDLTGTKTFAAANKLVLSGTAAASILGSISLYSGLAIKKHRARIDANEQVARPVSDIAQLLCEEEAGLHLLDESGDTARFTQTATLANALYAIEVCNLPEAGYHNQSVQAYVDNAAHYSAPTRALSDALEELIALVDTKQAATQEALDESIAELQAQVGTVTAALQVRIEANGADRDAALSLQGFLDAYTAPITDADHPLANITTASELKQQIARIQTELHAATTGSNPRELPAQFVSTSQARKATYGAFEQFGGRRALANELLTWGEQVRRAVTDPDGPLGAEGITTNVQVELAAVFQALPSAENLQAVMIGQSDLDLVQTAENLDRAVEALNAKIKRLQRNAPEPEELPAGTGIVGWVSAAVATMATAANNVMDAVEDAWEGEIIPQKPQNLQARIQARNATYPKAARSLLDATYRDAVAMHQSLKDAGAAPSELATLEQAIDAFSSFKETYEIAARENLAMVGQPGSRQLKIVHDCSEHIDAIKAGFAAAKSAMGQRTDLSAVVHPATDGADEGIDAHLMALNADLDVLDQEATMNQQLERNEEGRLQLVADPAADTVAQALSAGLEAASQEARTADTEAAEASLRSLTKGHNASVWLPAAIGAVALATLAGLQFRMQLQAVANRAWQFVPALRK